MISRLLLPRFPARLSLLRPLAAALFLTSGSLSAFDQPASPALPSPAAPAVEKGSWKIGDPIVTYWAGPGFPGGGPLNDAAASQMAAGGWNLVWCHENELDVAKKHSLRGLLTSDLLRPETLDNPQQLAALEALIGRVRRHPGLYAYHLVDEPSAAAFPAIGKLVAWLRERDPGHLAYINLLPTYASNAQLGTTGDTVPAYNEHLRQYVETVKPALLSYDHYQFTNSGTGAHYFLNLALVRAQALKSGLPFMNIVQASAWGPTPLASPQGPRVPTPDELRYLVNTTLAYGAQGISYYVYCYPEHLGGITQADGTPTPLYDVLKIQNPEFVRIARELQPLRSLSIRHGGMHPPGTEPLSPEARDSGITFDPPIGDIAYQPGAAVEGVILSLFGPGQGSGAPSGSRPETFSTTTATDKTTHFFVMNADSQKPRSVGLRSLEPLEILDAATGQWSPVPENQRLELQLPPGGGKLLRVIPGKS